ncbi:MAG: sodium:proline symporter, partial [Candidatus Eremiobacteraeota bacterium]|nr:sodium:proline symporter [Candidatus Eremiobacteraeota bacterium]
TFTAGVGLVMILRWYWWRVNAWSEIAALASSGIIATALTLADAFPGTNQVAATLLVTVAGTTLVWVAVTMLTAPEQEATLVAFYKRVRPARAGWAPIARAVPSREHDDLGVALRDWVAGCALVYSALFGIGELCLGETAIGIALLALAGLCIAIILRDLNQRAPVVAVAQLAPETS